MRENAHIRQSAAPARYNGRRPSSGGYASVNTICGAEATTGDLTWRDAKRGPEWVTCPDCRSMVLSAPREK